MNLQLVNASLNFGSPLFENLSIKFEGPGIIGLLGPSGCGKSTLIRMLAGLQALDSGNLSGSTQLNKSFVFQDSQLLPWRNTFENVALPLELHNKTDESKIHSALHNVNLKNSAKLFPHELSGGMKMRVSLARAFVTNPQILFCDEPFAALDEVTRENLQKQLRSYVTKHQTLCFFVTHSLNEVLNMSDRICYFSDRGKIHPDPIEVDRANPLSQLPELKALYKTR